MVIIVLLVFLGINYGIIAVITGLVGWAFGFTFSWAYRVGILGVYWLIKVLFR